jgi:drug/metabolite transporter (DMT)-like permease
VSPRLVAILQTLVVVLATAFVSVLAKLALRSVPAFTFVWLQIAIGGAALTAFTLAVGRPSWPRLDRRGWLLLVAIGIGNFSLVRVLFLAALARLPATTFSYLVNFVGLVTMAASALLLREVPTRRQGVGAVVALAGLRLFFEVLPAPEARLGVAMLAAGILALALTNVATRHLLAVSGGALSTRSLSTLCLWIGGVPLVLGGLVFDREVPTDPSLWGIIALNGVVSIAVGLTVWNHVLRTLRAYEASLLASSGVVFTALFAVPLLGEQLGLRQALGIAVVLVGLGLVAQPARPRPT